jgi:hypothetical protein
MLYELEVDVAWERPPAPANIRTHYVTVDVGEKRLGMTAEDNEARNMGAAMGAARGPMVTAVRIVSVEL